MVQNSRPANQLFKCSTTKNNHTKPHGYPGNAYFIIWKVSTTSTYANENEEQPGGTAGRIFKKYYDRKITKQLKRYVFLCVMC